MSLRVMILAAGSSLTVERRLGPFEVQGSELECHPWYTKNWENRLGPPNSASKQFSMLEKDLPIHRTPFQPSVCWYTLAMDDISVRKEVWLGV